MTEGGDEGALSLFKQFNHQNYTRGPGAARPSVGRASRRRGASCAPFSKGQSRQNCWEALDLIPSQRYSGEGIFLRLAKLILQKPDPLSAAEGLDGTPAQLLVAYISDWAAQKIKFWSPCYKRSELGGLRELLSQCARLVPNQAVHQYRLGALL